MLDQRQLMPSNLKINFMFLHLLNDVLLFFFYKEENGEEAKRHLVTGMSGIWNKPNQGGPRPPICCSKESDGEHLATYCSCSVSMVLIS